MSVSGSIAKVILRLAMALLLPAAAAVARPCPPVEVRAMTYNIRLDLASDGLNAWSYRRNELIGQVEIARPDLLGLQEVLINQQRDMAAALPDYLFLGVARDDGKEAGEFSSLLVRKSAFAVGRNGTFWLSPTPDRPSLGWDAGYKRVVTWAHLTHRKSGAAILALNTHWDHQGLTARRESGALIANWVAQNRLPGEDVLLMGDFNAPMTEASMKILTDAGLANSRAIAREALGGETTWNDFQALPAANEPAIDHILIGSGWKVRRNATIAQHMNGRVASDHFPVVADLALGDRSRCR